MRDFDNTSIEIIDEFIYPNKVLNDFVSVSAYRYCQRKGNWIKESYKEYSKKKWGKNKMMRAHTSSGRVFPYKDKNGVDYSDFVKEIQYSYIKKAKGDIISNICVSGFEFNVYHQVGELDFMIKLLKTHYLIEINLETITYLKTNGQLVIGKE